MKLQVQCGKLLVRGILKHLFPNYLQFNHVFQQLVELAWTYGGSHSEMLRLTKIIDNLLEDSGSCETLGCYIVFRKGQTRLTTGEFDTDLETGNIKDILVMLHSTWRFGGKVSQYNGKTYTQLELYAEIALEIAHVLR